MIALGRYVVVSIVASLALVSLARPGVITGSRWEAIGPQPGAWPQLGAGSISGRATAIAVNPLNADDVWLGTANGGVWHSSNGGVNWTPTSGDQASLAIGAIALAGCTAGGCTTVYAGTGENGIRRSTYYGQGLLVGTVGGGGSISWILRKGQPYDFSYGSIVNVLLDPTTSGTGQAIYITLSSGVSTSAGQATVTAPEPSPGGYGIYKSADNGVTWTKLNVEGATGVRPTDLELVDVVPGTPATLTLMAGFFGLGIFRSADSGATWCPLDPGIPGPGGCPAVTGLPDPSTDDFDHVEIARYRLDNQVLYASFGQCPDPHVANCQPAIYKTTNGGASWGQTFAGRSQPAFECDTCDYTCPYGYSRYTHPLTVAPTNPAKLFIGGYHLCVSPDSGETWSHSDTNLLGKAVSNGFEMVHPDHHAMVFAESNPARAYNASDGGFAVSNDGGATWRPRNDTLNTMQFQSLDGSPATARVIGGFQDNAGMMWLGARQWKHLECCGDGGFSVLDDWAPDFMWITSNVGANSDLISPPMRSRDGGGTFPKPSVDNYNVGLDPADKRSFYPPLIQGPAPTGFLYYGTTRLWRGDSTGFSFTAKSPVLSNLAPQPDIYSNIDVITAIAVAPTNPNRIYLGYYSGRVFTTTSACDQPGCWSEITLGLPAAPITSLAVDPVNEEVVYATLGGFFQGIHVYKKIPLLVAWFATAGHPDLDGVPANVVAVEPADRNRVWIGTDKGLYKSTSAGNSWFWFGANMPNVPVFQIHIDAARDRVFAATHGRGAYLLSQPTVSSYDVCVDNTIHGLSLTGISFHPNQACFASVLQQNWTDCAMGSQDADGATITTDDQGVLVASKPPFYTNKPVVQICANGNCLGTPIAACNKIGNPASTVAIHCGIRSVYYPIAGCPPLTSTIYTASMALGLPAPAPIAPEPDATPRPGDAAARSPEGIDPMLDGAGLFEVRPALHASDGSSRILCQVGVPYTSADSASMVLEQARDLINADPICLVSGVSARVLEPVGEAVEDEFGRSGSLVLSSTDLMGSQLVPSVRALPGQTPGICFRFDALGDPVHDQSRLMKVNFMTPATGAAGGQVTVSETTGLGVCALGIPTISGQSAPAIAAAVAAAFQAPDGQPGAPLCPTGTNPRDLIRRGNSIETSQASLLEVCLDDMGIGVTIGPAELCGSNAECDDANPCTNDFCNLPTGQCHSLPAPDGLPCNDGDLCTLGGVCVNSRCGTPVICQTPDPCNAGRCDPATGACLFQPLLCDDGNVCTADFCDPERGGCTFFPLFGAVCNDGDLCTTGEVCDSPPGGGAPVCRGTATCDDGDACTSDSCDPTTGLCQVAPIQCDDGNPCTIDSCSGGSCSFVPAIGAICDDGQACTGNDHCLDTPAGITCVGTPLDCDDGNPCSVDSCDPAAGSCSHVAVGCDDGNSCTADACDPIAGCLHTPVSRAEPSPAQFSSAMQLAWPATPDATHWNSYRGTIPATMLGSRPASMRYDHACFESADAFADGPTLSTDAAIPPPGTGFYYQISGEADGCESPLGHASDGTPVPNAAACPTPP